MTSSAAGFLLRYGAGERPIPETPFRLEPVGGREEASAPGPIGPVALEERIRTLGTEILSLPVARDGRAGRSEGKERLLFVVSDGTRKTGIRLILPGLVDRIETAGRYDIQFAIASGLHRRPERREFERLIGPGLPDRFPVILHDPDDPSGLEQVGTTARGTCVKVHRALQEADRTVLTGSVGVPLPCRVLRRTEGDRARTGLQGDDRREPPPHPSAGRPERFPGPGRGSWMETRFTRTWRKPLPSFLLRS